MKNTITYCTAFIPMLIGMSISFFAYANTDSLLMVWNDKEQADSVRFNALERLCGPEEYLFVYPDSSIYYTGIGYDGARQKDDLERMFRFLYLKVIANQVLGEFNESLAIVEVADSILSLVNNEEYKIKLIGLKTNAQLSLGNYFDAIDGYFDLIKIYERLGDEDGVITVKSNLGIAYTKIDEYDKAIEYFETYLSFHEKMDNKRKIMSGLHNLATAYSENGDQEQALVYFERLIPLYRENNDTRLAPGLYGLASAYFDLGNTKQAEMYFREAFSLIHPEHESGYYGLISLGIAKLYENSQPDSAFIYANEALRTFQKTGEFHYIAGTSIVLSRLYEAKGEYQKALEMQKKYTVSQDSMLSEKIQKKLFKKQAEYEYEKQKLVDQIKFEQVLAQQQLKTQFSIFFLGSFLIIVVIVFVSVLRVRKKISEHERSTLLKELEQIKERFTLKSVSSSVEGRENEFKLKKDALELFIGTSLGESSWNILNVIFENPTISNKGIAEKVFLGEEGVSSSLRRMYKTFDIQAESKQNLKVALLSKALELSI